MRTRGVILDVDGTLVDSNTAHARAWVEAFAEHGRDVAYDRVLRCIGMGGDKLMPAVAGVDKESAEGKAISRRRGELFRERYLPSLRPTRGAVELLRRLHDQGLAMAVASSAKEEELGPLLRVCEGDRWVEHKTSSDDVEKSKPDPDVVQAALGRLGLPADAVVMLGDTPYDIEGAGRAGVAVVAFRCGGWDDAGLAGAVEIYDDPADLLAQWNESPFGRTG